MGCEPADEVYSPQESSYLLFCTRCWHIHNGFSLSRIQLNSSVAHQEPKELTLLNSKGALCWIELQVVLLEPIK